MLCKCDDANVVNFKLRSVLHVAVYEESLRCVDVLLQHSASLTAQVTYLLTLSPAARLTSVRLVAGSQQRHFLQAPKDVFVCNVLIYVQRIRAFTRMRDINLRFTYLLTYLTLSNALRIRLLCLQCFDTVE